MHVAEGQFRRIEGWKRRSSGSRSRRSLWTARSCRCIPMGRRRNRPSQRQDHERERSEPIALPCCPTRARLTGPPTTGPPSCRDPHGTQSTLAREQQGAGVVWMGRRHKIDPNAAHGTPEGRLCGFMAPDRPNHRRTAEPGSFLGHVAGRRLPPVPRPVAAGTKHALDRFRATRFFPLLSRAGVSNRVRWNVSWCFPERDPLG